MLKPRWRVTPLDLGAVLLPFLVFAGMVGIWQSIFGRDPDEPLREQHIAALAALEEAPPEAMTFYPGTHSQAITAPADISEFLQLLIEPKPVHYHHPHPEGDIRFGFENNSDAYVLGRDSQVTDGYWLQLDAGTSPRLTLKLFRSEGLRSWLMRNGLMEE